MCTKFHWKITWFGWSNELISKVSKTGKWIPYCPGSHFVTAITLCSDVEIKCRLRHWKLDIPSFPSVPISHSGSTWVSHTIRLNITVLFRCSPGDRTEIASWCSKTSYLWMEFENGFFWENSALEESFPTPSTTPNSKLNGVSCGQSLKLLQW